MNDDSSMGMVAMVFPRARLVVSAGLFLAWIGFLAYMVARTRDPVILSRPQLAVCSLVVIAEVQEKEGRPLPTVTIKKVAWAATDQDAKTGGTQLVVEGLADCGNRQGWRGPGEYIVPLTKRKVGSDYRYEVTPLPLSPGYRPEFVTVEIVHVGPEKEKVAELARELLGGPNRNDALGDGIGRHNVPRERAEEIKKKLEAVKANVRVTESETRIYRATPDALEQLDAVFSSGRRD
jgi:hypothetical protein